MSAGESLMPVSHTEDAKAELGIDAQFSRDADNVAVTTAPIVVGLTKEELEHYRNDPKYKFLRWALFILFWLTWVALFAAAILLIVMSPRDVNEADNKSWYQITNNYEIFVPAFATSDNDDIGDFKGIAGKLDHLKQIGVDSMLLTAVFEYHKDGFGPSEVFNYENVGSRVGSEEDLKELVSDAFDDGIRTVVDIPLTVSPHSMYVRNGFTIRNNTLPYPTLDVTRNQSRTLLLKTVQRLAGLGVHGVYIHGGDLITTPVKAFNELFTLIRQQVNNTDFAIFVGCVNGVNECKNLNASVIVTDPEPANTPASVIQALLEHANETVIDNTTSVTVLGNTVYRRRVDYSKLGITNPKDRYNFIITMNAIRLFVYPAAHTLYGDEYGLENANNNNQTGRMPWTDADKNAKFFDELKGFVEKDEYASSKILNEFKGMSTLRHKLRHYNTTFFSDNSVVHYSHDGINYALFFNKGNNEMKLKYSDYLPKNKQWEDVLKAASIVYHNGEDSPKTQDLSMETLVLAPYGHQIVKLAALTKTE